MMMINAFVAKLKITHALLFVYTLMICLYLGLTYKLTIKTKSFLRSKFHMKDLGEAEVILEIKITKTLNGLNLSQAHYVKKILKRFEH